MDRNHSYTFLAKFCNFLHGSTAKSVRRFEEILVGVGEGRTWRIASVLAQVCGIQFQSSLQAIGRVLGNPRVDVRALGARLSPETGSFVASK